MYSSHPARSWFRNLLVAVLLVVAGHVPAAQATALKFDGADDYVQTPLSVVPRDGTVEAWMKTTSNVRQAVFASYTGGEFRLEVNYRPGTAGNSPGILGVNVRYGTLVAYVDLGSGIYDGAWHHVAFVWVGGSPGTIRLYWDGQEKPVTYGSHGDWTGDTTRTGVHTMGREGMTGSYLFDGMIDEVRFWEIARTGFEVQEGMGRELGGSETGLLGYWKLNEGQGTVAGDSSPKMNHGTIVGATWTTDGPPIASHAAYGAAPAAAAVDVPRDVVLSWKPGESAGAHDVYFGASFADVNNANRANPLGVLVSQGQTAATLTPPGLLALGQTYYWRVDEVSRPPDSTIFKGPVWSFTTEPVSMPIVNVKATASSASTTAEGPEKTIDRSGLDAGDGHSVQATDMWLSSPTGPNPAWIQHEFDRVYRLHSIVVWNYNMQVESVVGLGIKKATIEYSLDGGKWTSLGATWEFAQASGQVGYQANTTVDCAGVAAKYVRITPQSNWGGFLKQYGLSEIRFLHIPVYAREPQPADGQEDVNPDTILSWRTGREAVLQKVFFGKDQKAVAGGTAQANVVTESRYVPSNVELGATYYWKVDEVNVAAQPNIWAGDVWSFTTPKYLVIDDFERYTDNLDAGEAIFQTWIDGWPDQNGSVVGHLNTPFAERTIVHDGRQAIPLEYNNIGTPWYSEAKQTWATPQDWTVHGADTLRLFFRGDPIRFIEPAPGKVTMSGAGMDIGGTADQFRFAAKSLNGNGSIVAKVTSLVNTNAGAKAGVMIRESLDPSSTFAYIVATPAQGVSFGWRATPNSIAQNVTVAGVPTVQWVKLTRTGNVLTAQYSADGKTWTDVKDANGAAVSQTITTMTGVVYIGLCVTSHSATTATTAEFSDIATTGSGAWRVVDVGTPQRGNDPGTLYVAVEDSSGHVLAVKHSDPMATVTTAWTEWTMPLAQFTAVGVNLARVKTLYIGVGDRSKPVPSGTGMLYIDDIAFGRPTPAPVVVSGRPGLAFDGKDDYVQTPLSNVPKDGTVEAWVKTSSNVRQSVFSSLTGGEFRLQVNYKPGTAGNSPGFLGVNVRFGTLVAYTNIGKGMYDGAWHHVAFVWEGGTPGTIRIYWDGQEQTVTYTSHGDWAGNSNRTGLHAIGREGVSGSYLFNGNIGEVRFWDKARTAAEIQGFMSRELVGDEPGLLGYWKLNEGQGTTALDSSPNKNDGLISGASWTLDGAPVTP